MYVHYIDNTSNRIADFHKQQLADAQLSSSSSLLKLQLRAWDRAPTVGTDAAVFELPVIAGQPCAPVYAPVILCVFLEANC